MTAAAVDRGRRVWRHLLVARSLIYMHTCIHTDLHYKATCSGYGGGDGLFCLLWSVVSFQGNLEMAGWGGVGE